MTDHVMATTTHTTEMRQLHEMNAVLARGRRETAASLGIQNGVPGDAVLLRLKAAGPPSYPYVFGIFTRDHAGAGEVRPLLVELHTAQLRAISDRCHLRGHIWGV
jgi:hypothetical protein